MKGYRIYEKRSELVDEYDPDESRVIKNYPVSDIYLTYKEAENEMSNMKPYYLGNPINCWSKGIGFYIETINIEVKSLNVIPKTGPDAGEIISVIPGEILHGKDILKGTYWDKETGDVYEEDELDFINCSILEYRLKELLEKYSKEEIIDAINNL